MTANIVNLGSPTHQNVQDLLPWFVMQTLDDGDRAIVDEHLQTCAACRRDVELHQHLREAHNDPMPERNVDRAFAALRTRLPATAARPISPTSWLQFVRDRWQLQRPWVGWAMALQSVVILGLAVALVPSSSKSGAEGTGLFHALSRPSASIATTRLVVVFAPQATAADMRRVLLASRTRIVDGPTAADAYILSVAPEHVEQALQLLRAEHSVLMIQSLDAGDAH